MSRRRRRGLRACLVQARTRFGKPRALPLELVELELGAADPVLRRRQRGIEAFIAEHAFQHGVAIGGGRLQELREPVLGEQDRPAEGVEGHPEQPLDTLTHRLLLQDRLEHLGVVRILRQAFEPMLALALASERTLRPPDLTVHPEQELDVAAVLELVDQGSRIALERWRLAVEREDDGVEDRRLAGADRSDDADEPPAPEVEGRPAPVRPESLHGQLTRTHPPPPRAPRGRARATPGAVLRPCLADSSRRTARRRPAVAPSSGDGVHRPVDTAGR